MKLDRLYRDDTDGDDDSDGFPASAGGGVVAAPARSRRIGRPARDGGDLVAQPGFTATFTDAARRSMQRKALVQFVVCVIVPTLLALFYYGVIATPRYVSEVKLVIETQSDGYNPMGDIPLPSIFGGSGESSQGRLFAEYVQSASLYRQLEDLISVDDLYTDGKIDLFSRLDADSSFVDRHDYFLGMIDVDWDASSEILTISSQAFTAADAALVLDALAQLGEERLNEVGQRQREDRMRFANQEVERAEDRLTSARLAVAEYRARYGEIDPRVEGQRGDTVLSQIMAQLTSAQTELAGMLSSLRPGSARVQAQMARILELERLAEEERAKVAGERDDDLADRVTEFEGLMIEQEFAQQTYASAIAFRDTVRAEAQRQSTYVVDFVEAVRPDRPTEPNVPYMVATVFVICALGLGIAKLAATAITEHARI